MKSSTKWVLATVTILVIAAYWYYQEQSCSMLTVHFIRHGETIATAGKRLAAADIQLTVHGREQASRIADKLTSSSIRELYASPEKRTYETATIIASRLHMQLIADERLDVRSTELSKEPLRQRIKPLFDFFQEMAKNHKSEVYLVGHGGSVRDLLEYIDHEAANHIAVANGMMYTFIYNPCSGSIRYQGYQELGM